MSARAPEFFMMFDHIVRQSGDDTSGNDTKSGDLVSDVGSEIQVTLDRWSAGQLGIADIIIAAAVVAAGFVLAWLVNRLIRRSARKLTGAALTAMGTIGQLAGGSIILMSAALALEILGFGLGPVLVLILVAVVAALLIRPMITNLSSGLLLQLRGSLDVGDLVQTAGGVIGTVREITTRTVAIDTSEGHRVHVPNSDVLNDVIVNYSALGHRRSSFELMLDATEDQPRARSTIRRALAEVDEIHQDPQPEVQVARLTGHLVVYRILVWHAPEQAAQRGAIDSCVSAVLGHLGTAGISLGIPTTLEVAGARLTGNSPEPTARLADE